MLRYIQYETSQDFFEQCSNFVGEPLVVCPNPQKADEARRRFDEAGHNFDTITISKFMQDQMKALLGEDATSKRKNKSALTLFLGAIWKKLKTESDYMSFVHAFNIFTELRSYSVETPVIQGVLELYDESLAEIINVFQNVMTDLDIVDEHGAYNLLTQRIREGDLPVDFEFPQELLLYGFETMTASQLDLLKTLSARTEIGLLIHKHLLESSTELDWVGWLKTDSIETVPSKEKIKRTVKAFEFSPGFLAHGLPREHDVLVLGTKKTDYSYIQEIPFALRYKQSVDLFSHAYSMVWEKIEGFEGSSDDLRILLQTEIKNMIEAEKFFEIKVGFIILNKLNEWEEISDGNQQLSEFDLNILRDASELDLPRVNKFDPNGKGMILDMSQIEGLSSQKVALIVSSQYQRLNFADHTYTDSIENYLAAIGPLRRSEFEFNLYLARLKELATSNDLELFIEQGLLKSEKQWKRLLDHFDFETTPIPLNLESKSAYLESKKQNPGIERISSSRLQTYSDCPRKYYYSYIEKLEPRVLLKDHLDTMELGQIQHKVIEVYLSKYSEFLEDKFLEVIHETLKDYFKEKTQVQVEGILVETRAYTQEIIKTLLDISKELQISFEFEKDFNISGEPADFIGSIDCFGTGSLFNLMLDFKRSGFSFSSQKSILEYEKNQLWFYLARLYDLKVLDDSKPLVFGYVDLSDITNSLLFSNDKEILILVSKKFGKTRSKELPELDDHLAEYRELESETLTALAQDSQFIPNPQSGKICDFCFQKATCPREQING